MYKNGSVLEKHTDRGACEISVTIHLDGDRSYPIWIKTFEGKDVSVDLQSGDGMIYLGCTAPHWREKYFGNSYSQLFFHYVREDGPCRMYEDDLREVPNPFRGNLLIETLIEEYRKLL